MVPLHPMYELRKSPWPALCFFSAAAVERGEAKLRKTYRNSAFVPTLGAPTNHRRGRMREGLGGGLRL
jgi:hypothetical protein